MFPYAVAAVLGLLVGSFLNVAIWRVPRKKSIVSPSSRCPSCETPIRAMDNVPILSYLALRGRCRHCGERISPRYPLIEALNALLYVLVLYRFGLGWALPAYFLFVSALIVITFIDLDFQIIPDSITLVGIPIGILAGSLVLSDPMARQAALGWQSSLGGAGAGFGLFYLVAVLSRGGMGGGDVKMMGMVGGVLGWKGVLMTTLLGSLLGSVLGVFLMVIKGRGRKTKIPFGPFLAGGALVTLLVGQEILRWYFSVGL